MLKKISLNIIACLLGMTLSNHALAKLPPASFNQMYKIASQGKIGLLKDAVDRGLNINAINKDGDTGLCVAIRNWDYRAYNSFRAAGAAPQTYCTGTIPPDHYKSFISSRHIPDFFKYEQTSFYDYTPPRNTFEWKWVWASLPVVALFLAM